MRYLLGILALGIAIACAYYLYGIRYPKPGTRPSFLKVMLQAPVAILAILSSVVSCSAFFDKQY